MPFVRNKIRGKLETEWNPAGDTPEHSLTVPIGGNIPRGEIEAKIAAVVDSHEEMSAQEIALYLRDRSRVDPRLNPVRMLNATQLDEEKRIRVAAHLKFLQMKEEREQEDVE